MTIREARAKLTKLADGLSGEREPMLVTRNGKPALAIMPWELWESFAETLDIMADEEAMGKIRRAMRNVDHGETYDLEEVERLIREDEEGSEAQAG